MRLFQLFKISSQIFQHCFSSNFKIIMINYLNENIFKFVNYCKFQKYKFQMIIKKLNALEILRLEFNDKTKLVV